MPRGQRHYEIDSEIDDEFDFEDEEYDDSLEPHVIIPNIVRSKKDLVAKFFSGKEMYCGGSIPEYLLFSDRYITDALSIPVGDAISLVYRAMGTFVDIDEEEPSDESLKRFFSIQALDEMEDDHSEPADIKKVLHALSLCSSEGVPKQHAGGLLIMYMELCEGIRIKI